jgi:hypothetical protein
MSALQMLDSPGAGRTAAGENPEIDASGDVRSRARDTPQLSQGMSSCAGWTHKLSLSELLHDLAPRFRGFVKFRPRHDNWRA